MNLWQLPFIAWGLAIIGAVLAVIGLLISNIVLFFVGGFAGVIGLVALNEMRPDIDD